MFGFLLERLFLRYPKESVFYVCDREEEKVCLCVFLSASILVCMWVSCLPPAGAITYLSVCHWNTVSLKEDNLDGIHSSQPGTYRSSIPQPPPTTKPSSNPTRHLPPPHWAPLCHLKPMHNTRGIFNSRHVHECQCSEISQLFTPCFPFSALWPLNTYWVSVREWSSRQNWEFECGSQ